MLESHYKFNYVLESWNSALPALVVGQYEANRVVTALTYNAPMSGHELLALQALCTEYRAPAANDTISFCRVCPG